MNEKYMTASLYTQKLTSLLVLILTILYSSLMYFVCHLICGSLNNLNFTLDVSTVEDKKVLLITRS